MVVAAWVELKLIGESLASVREIPFAMRGDNMAAVTWLNKCGGAKDKRAFLLMRMLGHLQTKDVCSHGAKHIPGAETNRQTKYRDGPEQNWRKRSGA